MFAVRRAAAKGLGVFATRHIGRGTRVLAESPLLSITTGKVADVLKAASSLGEDKLTRLLELSTNNSKKARRASLALSILPTLQARLTAKGHTSLATNRRIINIFLNNNFALGDVAGTRSLFPTVARLNHACVPSTQGNFNTVLGQFTIHALRDIPMNEEITISYLHDEMALRDARQRSLEAGYGFVCACPICAIGGHETHDSRRRKYHILLRRYQSLGQQQMSWKRGEPSCRNTTSHSDETLLLDLTRRMIDAYEVEGLAGRETASLYTIAAQHAMTAGRGELAAEMGRKAMGLERDAVGEDSPFYLVARGALERMDFAPLTARPLVASKAEDEALSYAPWT